MRAIFPVRVTLSSMSESTDCHQVADLIPVALAVSKHWHREYEKPE